MDNLDEFDISLKKFVIELFKKDPVDPHTFQLTLPESVRIQDFLGYLITYGANELYGSQLGQLSPEQIDYLRKYLKSLGWDVEYRVESREQEFENDQKRMVNYFLIDFIPAKIV